MKFDCGETTLEKIERLGKWHPWFAWQPVKVESHDCRWLETVWRRGNFLNTWGGESVVWEYSATKPDDTV